MEKLTNFKAGENCVMIAGYPKSGSHFLLQILNELGYARLYGETDGIVWKKIGGCFILKTFLSSKNYSIILGVVIILCYSYDEINYFFMKLVGIER